MIMLTLLVSAYLSRASATSPDSSTWYEAWWRLRSSPSAHCFMRVMCWRRSAVSLRSLSVLLASPGEITVTQASRAPGRMPSERPTASRSEYRVASVTS